MTRIQVLSAKQGDVTGAFPGQSLRGTAPSLRQTMSAKHLLNLAKTAGKKKQRLPSVFFIRASQASRPGFHLAPWVVSPHPWWVANCVCAGPSLRFST